MKKCRNITITEETNKEIEKIKGLLYEKGINASCSGIIQEAIAYGLPLIYENRKELLK